MDLLQPARDGSRLLHGKLKISSNFGQLNCATVFLVFGMD